MNPDLTPRPNPTAAHIDFILASGSPRRRELLAFLEIPFRVVLPQIVPRLDTLTPATGGGGVDETPLPGESPPELVQRLSRDKALAVTRQLPPPADRSIIVIAADTVVVSEGKILGKPADPTEATQMLDLLRRQHYHYVYSGLTLALIPSPPTFPDPRLLTRLHQSKVWMRPYSDAEIEAYVNSGDPLDKAGAYAIQSKSFDPVEQLEGCFASVMGLPLRELLSMLGEIGLSFPDVSQRCAEYSGHPCCIGSTPQV
jgi:MAF protein